MALYPCPECQNSISEKAKSCPVCGAEWAGVCPVCQHFREPSTTDCANCGFLFSEAAAFREKVQGRHNLIILVACQNCQRDVSHTALVCPACGKLTQLGDRIKSQEGREKRLTVGDSAKVAAGTALTVALGPIAIAGGLAGSLMVLGLMGDFGRRVKKTARKVHAIDVFPLGGSKFLVTRTGFVVVTPGLVFPELSFSQINKAYIDKPRCRDRATFQLEKYVVVLELSHGKEQTDISSTDYEYSGKGSRKMAEFACAKFREYALGGSPVEDLSN